MTHDNLDEADGASAGNWLALANGGGLLLRDPTPPSNPHDLGRTGRRVRALLTTSTDSSADGT